eukprot:CAMPEP_0206390754 /NCGR_PEP_ID=MMETSP0294-20121207/18818_1 /ASSEMBLY_ACC=CAM_ASM_000327 /TAXON_ID=39354 /ORGANISM="Heterosigma akashiwo, Strain CCMP2393" /LENGTH=144 /DNA_ID=CAMNT_0053843235 /DNA_START=349 /DNA_END=781 /DNA_ORIENTATION=+
MSGPERLNLGGGVAVAQPHADVAEHAVVDVGRAHVLDPAAGQLLGSAQRGAPRPLDAHSRSPGTRPASTRPQTWSAVWALVSRCATHSSGAPPSASAAAAVPRRASSRGGTSTGSKPARESTSDSSRKVAGQSTSTTTRHGAFL